MTMREFVMIFVLLQKMDGQIAKWSMILNTVLKLNQSQERRPERALKRFRAQFKGLVVPGTAILAPLFRNSDIFNHDFAAKIRPLRQEVPRLWTIKTNCQRRKPIMERPRSASSRQTRLNLLQDVLK